MPVLKNPKHERFAQELASGKSAFEAHSLAGYKPNSGNASVLKGDQRILARVDELLKEREAIHGQSTAKAIEAVGLTKEWVLGRLVENANRAMQVEAVKDGEGKDTGEYRYNGQVANRALELVGKELGMFVERKEVGKPGDFTGLDDATLKQKIVEKAAALGISVPKVLHS